MKSIEHFHAQPNNWNCAQAIQKGFQNITELTDQEIEERYRPCGGGRAEGGLCGALYSAECILKQRGLPSVKEEFISQAGASTCRELKQVVKFPCSSCVNLAEELLNKRLEEEELSTTNNK